MTIDNHKNLIENVKNENLLIRRLKELKFYKMIGLTKLSEIDVFNTLKKHRSQKVSKIKKIFHYHIHILLHKNLFSFFSFRLLQHFIILIPN